MRQQTSEPVSVFQPKTAFIQLKQDSFDDFAQAADYEWLVTNGLGGFATGTVAEANTRRYHGLLMVALNPPVDRTLLVSKIDITAHYQGRDWPLFSNEFMDGSVAPQGYRLLQSFHLDKGMPVCCYAFADVLIEKRLFMEPGRNITQLELRVVRAGDPIDFTLTPLCAYRDFHSQGEGGWEMQMEAQSDGFRITAFPGARPYHVSCPGARFTADPLWYWNFHHRVESNRGLDDSEDLFRPGDFSLELEAGNSKTLVLSAEESRRLPSLSWHSAMTSVTASLSLSCLKRPLTGFDTWPLPRINLSSNASMSVNWRVKPSLPATPGSATGAATP